MMNRSIVAGVDGYPGGWVCFQVDIASRSTDVQLLDLPAALLNRPLGLAAVAIDIPIGLLDGSRSCDRAARKLLGPVRGCSVFSAPCRAALLARDYQEACEMNRQRTGRKLSQQAWCICPKIRVVDHAISTASQQWAFEVHPEVCFWAMNDRIPMAHGKKTQEGKAERLTLLTKHFPAIKDHVLHRPPRVGVDDLIDAAAAAWSALRIYDGTAQCVWQAERDDRGLEVAIRY
jgi:predicted RNase H-like nuclease